MIHSSGIGESFGLSLAEAMYWGLPVIVDSTPGMDNAQIEVIDNGKNGIVVNSSRGFVTAAKKLTTDRELMKKFGASGKYKAEKLYSDKNVIKQWELLFIEGLQNKKSEIINEDMKNYAESIKQSPAPEEYDLFEKEYQARLSDIHHEKDNFLIRKPFKAYKKLTIR